MLTIAGVLLFTALAIFWLGRSMRNDEYRLSPQQVAAAFSFKILLGCVYGYIFLTKYEGDDTWWLHEYALGQQQLLIEDPLLFLSELNPFTSPRKYDNSADHLYYYLGDLEVWAITKPLAFINFLTSGNYYINLVFFNLPVFYAQFWLYRLLRNASGIAEKPAYVAVFLVPPVVFWLSGLRPDGLLFFSVMLTISGFLYLLRKTSTKNLFAFIAGMIGILIFRSYLLALLLPAFIAWYLVDAKGKKPLATFSTVYIICVVLFFATTLLPPGKNAAVVIANRQQAFFALEGNTRFHLDTLKPEAGSFARILPQAVNNTIFRPYPWEAKGALQYAAAAGVLLFVVLLALCFLRPHPAYRRTLESPFTLTILFFAVFQIIIIGLTVPFPGAIVRYKIIGELFILSVLAGCIAWERGVNGSH
ncbi:MAG: hypothetical protein EOO01_03825 [Chitinophagaceae bacterium]|nr:MAG: hypothetical protein EOO01_03825 [Chitinophagaceae bacterium]